MSQKLKPSKFRVWPLRWWLRRPTPAALKQLSPLLILLFNLYLIVAASVLFQENPRPLTMGDGTVVEVHGSGVVPALLSIGLASAVLIVKQGFEVFRDRLWRRQITRDLLDKVMRDPKSMKLGSDGELVLDVEKELRRRRGRVYWPRPCWTYQHFWFSRGPLASVFVAALEYALMGFMCYIFSIVMLIFIHTPEVVVRLGVMIAAPQMSTFAVNDLVGYAYVLSFVMGLLALMIIMVKAEGTQRR